MIDLLDYPKDDRDPERRLAAIRLGLARDKSAAGRLNAHLQGDLAPRMRAACAWAVAQIGDPSSLPFLVTATSDKDPVVRREAIRGLGAYSQKVAVTRLETLARALETLDGQLALRVLGKPQKGDPILVQNGNGVLPKANPASAGRAVYVDATSGADSNKGGPNDPFRTLGRGIREMVAGRGDTLLATSGGNRAPFREQAVVGPDQTGTFGAPTVIRNWPGRPQPMIYASVRVDAPGAGQDAVTARVDKPVLCVFAVGEKATFVLPGVPAAKRLRPGSFHYDPEQNQLSVMRPKQGQSPLFYEACVWPDAILINGADHVRIVGFVAAFAKDTGINFQGAYHGVVADSQVHSCDRHGIFFYYSAFGTVSECEASGCQFQGISIRSSPQSLVHRAFVHDNGSDGVLFLYESDGGVVSGCRFDRNTRGVGFINNSRFGRVLGSTFYANKRDVEFEADSGIIFFPESLK